MFTHCVPSPTRTPIITVVISRIDRRTLCRTLNRLTFTGPGGTEIELRAMPTRGEPLQAGGCYGGPSRPFEQLSQIQIPGD